MRRFLVITIPIVALAIFVLIMISNNFLKYSLGADDNVPGCINAIIQDITNDQWDTANNKTDQLSRAWNKVVKRIQFSAEKDEIDGFNKNIARLRGAIMTKDKPNALMELQEAYEHWVNIGR